MVVKDIDHKYWQELSELSNHNQFSDTTILGKYDGGSPTNYINQAKNNGYNYFDFGAEMWDDLKIQNGWTDDDMFKLFNEPFLDDAVSNGNTIRFSHNPLTEGGALLDEWKYLQDAHGFKDIVPDGGGWIAIR